MALVLGGIELVQCRLVNFLQRMGCIIGLYLGRSNVVRFSVVANQKRPMLQNIVFNLLASKMPLSVLINDGHSYQYKRLIMIIQNVCNHQQVLIIFWIYSLLLLLLYESFIVLIYCVGVVVYQLFLFTFQSFSSHILVVSYLESQFSQLAS